MKTKIIQNIKSFILVLILVLGVSYAYANFTSPLHTPPTCLTGEPGCDAPINVGSNSQTKSGTLTLGGLGIVGDLKFIPASGISPTSGQVLMADDSDLAHGKVKWGGSCRLESGVATGFLKDTPKTVTFPTAFPSGVTPVVVVINTVSTAQTYISNISNTGFTASATGFTASAQAATDLNYIAVSGSNCTF